MPESDPPIPTGYELPPQHQVPDPTTQPLTVGKNLAYSSFWAASNLVWGALLITMIPSQAEILSPTNKAGISGTTVAIGAIAALFVPLIFGPMSDRCMHPLGRRRPYIFAGVVINLIGLFLLYFSFQAKIIPAFFASYFLMTTGNNIATAAYSGIIPDLVPKDKRGTASGYMAVMSQVGTIIGVIVAGYLASSRLWFAAYLFFALALVAGLFVSMKWIQEKPLEEQPPRETFWEHVKSLWIDPRKYPDFAWVWITRALVMFGFYAILPLLQYYLQDAIGVAEPEKAAGKLVGVVVLGAAVSSYFGGVLSDRFGRKKIVYFANSFMSVMCIGFIFATSLPQVTLCAVLFGLGYGAYISVDWALGTDVLPNPDDSAKDMAVWHVSMTLPQSIAPMVGAALVGMFGHHEAIVKGEKVIHYNNYGFAAIFTLAAVFLGLGALLLRNVKGST